MVKELIQEYLFTFNYDIFDITRIEVWEENCEDPTNVYMSEDIERMGRANKCKSIW